MARAAARREMQKDAAPELPPCEIGMTAGPRLHWVSVNPIVNFTPFVYFSGRSALREDVGRVQDVLGREPERQRVAKVLLQGDDQDGVELVAPLELDVGEPVEARLGDRLGGRSRAAGP
jgi:hypothetical protein